MKAMEENQEGRGVGLLGGQRENILGRRAF